MSATLPWGWGGRPRDRCDKTIAASGDRRDISVIGLTTRQRAAQRGNLKLEIALDDDGMRPDLCDQLRLADHLTRTLSKSDQKIESAAADLDRLVIFQQ